jgi:hypothetical protein
VGGTAIATGGKLVLAFAFGFLAVATGGFFGICCMLILYAIGIAWVGAVEPQSPAPLVAPTRRGRFGGPSLTVPVSLRYGSYLRMARRAAHQIEQSVRSGPLCARATLADLPRRAAELEHRTRELARAGEAIRHSLAGHSRTEGESRERALRLRLRVTQDPVARSHFEQALRALAEETSVYDRMRAALERVEAQLAHAAYALSCTQSKVTALTAGPDVGGVSGDALARDLDALSRELAAFDAALNEVLDLEPPPTPGDGPM